MGVSSKKAEWFFEQLNTNPEMTQMLLDKYLKEGREAIANLAHSQAVCTDVIAINREERANSKLVRAENIKLTLKKAELEAELEDLKEAKRQRSE